MTKLTLYCFDTGESYGEFEHLEDAVRELWARGEVAEADGKYQLYSRDFSRRMFFTIERVYKPKSMEELSFPVVDVVGY